MTLTNQALSSAADKDLELSKQVCREAVNEVIEKNAFNIISTIYAKSRCTSCNCNT